MKPIQTGQTELHRHLDGAIRPATLLELLQERGLEPQSTSLEGFREKLILTRPLANLSQVLDRLRLFQKVYDRPEVLERLAFEGVEDCWKEGTRRVEFRYAPGFVCEKSALTWDESLDAIERGIHRGISQYPKMQVGLICIGVRDEGPEGVDAAVNFFLKHQNRFIGMDLAGNEDGFPCRLFEASFKKIHSIGAKTTIHAGEAAGPESMWEAIELLGARRIGHGIAAIRDPSLMRTLSEKRICLEVCPTSNWITQSVPTLEVHPLKELLEHGIPVAISTDDPGIFGNDLPQEFQVCREKLGLSSEQIQHCTEFAHGASFIEAPTSRN